MNDDCIAIKDPTTVAKIAELEPGWASGPDVAWSVANDDSYKARGHVRNCLNDLYRVGLLKRIYVRHNDEPLPCYLIDPTLLQSALEDWAE